MVRWVTFATKNPTSGATETRVGISSQESTDRKQVFDVTGWFQSNLTDVLSNTNNRLADIKDLLYLEEAVPGVIEKAIAASAASGAEYHTDFTLTAPISTSEKIIGVGLNYRGHAKECGMEPPTQPMLFTKMTSAVTGPYDDIMYPEAETNELDWEVELVVVIGSTGRRISVENAKKYIFGYTVGHDVSARDWQLKPELNAGQWWLGKSMDTFAPLGPAIVDGRELSDASNLGLRCRVNGKTMQDSSTSDMVFGPAELVSHISRFMTLRPGDLIFTGTPGGVGLGMKPPVYLNIGDVVECEVDGIGTIRNPVKGDGSKPRKPPKMQKLNDS